MPARITLPLALCAGLVALSAPAAADAPGEAEAFRPAPRRLAHRPLPPAGFAGPRGDGIRRTPPLLTPQVFAPPVSGGLVRAYLPRNHTVPMYNEPPPR